MFLKSFLLIVRMKTFKNESYFLFFMPTVYDVNPNELILKVSEELQNYEELQPPDWISYTKTGAHKERPPEQENFWYIRAAALLRAIYKKPSGVSKLRTKYGGKRRRGHKPAHFRKGSGAIIRRLLQQLEKAGLVEKKDGEGRFVTSKGRSLLDKASAELLKGNVKK